MTHPLFSMKNVGPIAILGIASLILFASIWRIEAVEPETNAATFGERILVKTADHPNVYFIENGTKRLIPSETIFRAQGFRDAEIVIVDANDLSRLPDGEPIAEGSSVMLASENGAVPDLVPFAPLDIRVIRGSRTQLNFSTSFWNRGGSPFIIRTRSETVTTDEGTFLKTFQRIVRADGSARERRAGTFLWDTAHGHYHNDHLIDYVLERVSPTAQTIVKQKTTFCLRDDAAVSLAWRGAPQRKIFTGCGRLEQGVSIGWADVYPRTLPGQNIDITGLPAGIYRLSFSIDPLNHFLEARKDNNVSAAFLELNPARGTVRVISTGAPYIGATNRYEDGMLIKADGDARVYAIFNNKKRWIRTEQAFRSYGYADANIRVLPQAMIDVIPTETFVRFKANGSVFMINEAGYKRRILNPDVLRSYGATGRIVEVTAEEMATYPDTTLIRRANESTAYSIVTKQPVEFNEDDVASIHVVNQTDFNAYGIADAALPVRVVAEGLDTPWDMAVLPNGDLLVTERGGTVRRIGASPASIALPAVVETSEGGLMGMALHPDFASNAFVYLYYTTNGSKNQVVRFRLDGNRLVNDKLILDNVPAAEIHDGGQVAFGPDGMLYVSTGDANVTSRAQDRNSLAGKILRLTPEGDVPSDNPFGNAVWSYGHRNIQGLAWDDRGRLWATEHGRSGAASGLDELNLIVKGGNYGWPTIQGDEQREGMIAPARHSGATTTWAPAGLAFLNGKLYFAGLRGAALFEATIDANGRVTGLRELLKDAYGRLRGVIAPDDSLRVSTSNRDGRGTPRTGDDKILIVAPERIGD